MSFVRSETLSARVFWDGRVGTGCDVSAVMRACQSGTQLPMEAIDGRIDMSGLSPDYTRLIIVYGSPLLELHVKATESGAVLAKLPLEDLKGEVYDLTIDSKARFYLKVDRRKELVQIPYDIAQSRSWDPFRKTITRGKSVPLSERRETSPYTLDANSAWVLGRKSRKMNICWISPENLRRGGGGHFWIGPSLVMVGDDGVVRKVTFKELDRRSVRDAM